MAAAYGRLRLRLADMSRLRRGAVDATIEEARANHSRSVRTMSAILLVCLLAMAFLSQRVIRTTLAPLRRAVATARALPGATGATTSAEAATDELAFLVSALQSTLTAVHESELRYRALFDDSPQPMWVYDQDTLRFLAVNDAAVDHYGYSRDEFLAMHITDIRPEEDREAVVESVRSAASGLRKAGVWRHRRKDGALIEVDVASHEVRFGTDRARLVLATDVTEQRRLERQLRQSQKMEAVGLLAGGVAHDFNNVLGVILGYGEMVSRRLPPTDPLVGKMAQLLKAVDRASNLTRQLLAFSRKQVLQPRVLDLNEVVRDMDKMLRRLITSTCARGCRARWARPWPTRGNSSRSS
jgi:PAS domain S-box-containing protein